MVAMAMVVMGDMCVQSHPHTTTISNFYVLYSLRLVVVKHYCQCIMVIHSTINFSDIDSLPEAICFVI